MESPLRKKINSIMRDHKKRQMWYRIVTSLAVVVVFVTTYMLILPAITMENKAECGITEHKHDANCYSTHYETKKVLACTTESLGVHKHTDACYNAEHKLICGYADFVIHQHDASCYDEDGNLVCTIPEHTLHQHTESCYQTQKQLVCTQEESAGHTHTAECYTKEKGDLICTKEEHTHDESCYDAEGNLICGKEEHVHGDECYQWNDVLTCTIPESAGHQHSDACYQDVKVLVCEEPAELHTHTAECYKDGVLACGKMELKEHKHDDSCYKDEQVLVEKLVCDRVEHVHTDECYKKSESSEVEIESSGEASSEVISSEADSSEAVSENEEVSSGEESTSVEDVSSEFASEEVSSEEISSEEESSEEVSTEAISTEEGSTEEITSEEASDEETSTKELSSEEASTEEVTSEAETEEESSEEESSEAELPDLTGNWSVDMMLTAQSLIGYEKSDFVKFCLEHVGVSSMAYNSNLEAWIVDLTEQGLYASGEDFDPTPGDVIFFDKDEDGKADHIGIVTDILVDDEYDVSTLMVAENNEENVVEENSYKPDDKCIVGHSLFLQDADHSNDVDNMNAVEELKNYITSITMKKKNGNNYEDASEFQDGDQVKVSLEYKVDHGKITQEKRTLIYQLPDGVRPNQSLSGKVKGTIAGVEYDDLGDYTIGMDGKISITFNDTFFTTNGEFLGGIDFAGTASLDNSSESKDVKFTADGKTYTIKPKPKDSDLTIKKTRSEAKNGKITYTITASSKNGTDGEKVKIVDKLSYSGLDKVTVNKPNIAKGGENISYGDSEYISKSSDGSYEYTLTLPPLKEGEEYTVSYEVDYGKVVGDGYAHIHNDAVGYKGDTWKSNASTDVEISKQMVKKSGSATDNNQAIKWTIDVNPNHLDNVAGEYTIKDLLNGEEFDLSKAEDFKIMETDTVNGWKQTDVTETAFKNGKLAVRNNCFYSITYKTKVDYGTGTSATYNNKVSVGDYEAGSGDVKVGKSELFKDKKPANNQKLLEDGKTVQQEWTITLNPEKDSKDSFTVTDVMTDIDGSVNGDLHYTTKALLEDAFSKFKQENIRYTFTCYDANGTEVNDNDSHVVKFVLTITPNGAWDGDAVHVNYKSLFSAEGLQDGETIKVKNTATVGDVSHDAQASYTKKKSLFKYVYGKDQYGNSGWRSGSWNVDFNEAQGKLKYRILVLPDSTNEFTVTDVIPEGLSLRAEDVVVKFSTSNNSYEYTVEEGYDITAEANKPEVVVDGQNLTVKIKGGFPQKIVNEGLGFAIDYTVSITDEFWDNLKNTEKTYTNIAGWNGKTEPQETTIERHTPVLDKEGEQLMSDEGEPLNEVKYYVIINAAGEKLNNGKPLTLTDTLNADGLSVALQTENVKLYSYDRKNASNHYKGQELSASAFQFQYNEAEKKFTVAVPDETPCVLEYVYEIENMNDKFSATFSNSVSLSGVDGSTSTKNITIKEAESSAWVKKSDQLQLVKVDADRYQITLEGAEFKLQKYGNSSWQDVEGTYTTGTNGTCVIDLKKLTRDCLYSVSESKAPDGYARSDVKYYFVALDRGTTKDNWCNSNQQSMSQLSIAKSDITFIEHSGFKELYIPNKLNSLKVIKLWRSPDGSPMQGTKDVTVQLYRNTTKKEFYTVTVQFIGTNGDNNYGSLKYLVKPNTDFTLRMTEWNSSFMVKYDGKTGTVDSSNGVASFAYGSITKDTVIQVQEGWDGMDKERYCNPVYTPAEYVVDASTPYGDPITLTSSNGYIGVWNDLPSSIDGAPVYYTVKETSNLGGYTISYLNNDGIQSGEITIINKKDEETITLPETGGTGTYPYTLGGLLLLSGAALLMYINSMRKGGKRIW